MAHCCRKNKKYDEALRYHQQALTLKPQSAPTYTAMGLVYAIKGDLRSAIDYLHKSLALKRDDIVANLLLKSCMEESADDDRELDDDDDISVITINETKRQCTSAAAMLGSDTRLRKITFRDDSNDSSDTETNMDMTDD